MGLMTGHDGALPNPRGVKLTYDDFVLFPDDGLPGLELSLEDIFQM